AFWKRDETHPERGGRGVSPPDLYLFPLTALYNQKCRKRRGPAEYGKNAGLYLHPTYSLTSETMKTVKQLALATAMVVTFSISAFAQKNFICDADKAYEAKQYYHALELYKKGLARIDKKNEKARCIFQAAQCHRAMNDWRQAETWYAKAVKAKYEDARVYLYLAECKKMNEKYAEAIEQFTNYSKEVPDDPAGRNGIKSSELALKWKENPTRWKVENEVQLNSPQYDFSPAYYDKKHSSLIISSKREGQAGGSKVDKNTGNMYSDLFETKMGKVVKQQGKEIPQWSALTPLAAPVNTSANEGSCVLNKKTDKMFFTRCGEEKKKMVTCKIYMAERQGASWSAGELVDFSLDAATLDSFNFRHPALSPDETVMVFSSDMQQGNFGAGNIPATSDLWMSVYDKKTKKWGRPVNLGSEINTTGREAFPFIREDGTLYFASNQHPGMGGMDIHSAARKNKENWQWASVTNMQSPINSAADDFGIIFDGLKNRGFLTSNREGTKGVDDIWRFYLPPCVLDIEITMKECKAQSAFAGASVRLAGSDGSAVEGTSDQQGKLGFKLLPEVSYVVSVLPYDAKSGGKKYLEPKEKYRFSTLGTSNGFDECSAHYTYECCIGIAEDTVDIAFPAVLYDLTSAKLRPESKDSLNALYKTLVEYPNITIELGSHTDCRASDPYNLKLSEARAKACMDYLIKEKGIPASRIAYKGYGERRPLKLPDGTVLTEKYIAGIKDKKQQEYYHQLNRRTVFRVTGFDYADPNAPKIDRTIVVPIIRDSFWDESDEKGQD
ncbi:MAG: outer membrane protein/peptidoglycan-associated (lipo)protein, partial [Bacteroidetes bacterium]